MTNLCSVERDSGTSLKSSRGHTHTPCTQRGGAIPDKGKCTHSHTHTHTHTHTQHCAVMQSIHKRLDEAQCFCLHPMRRECTLAPLAPLLPPWCQRRRCAHLNAHILGICGTSAYACGGLQGMRRGRCGGCVGCGRQRVWAERGKGRGGTGYGGWISPSLRVAGPG